MPCTTSVPHQHRVKNPQVKFCFNAMVTRPVTRAEMLSNPKAMGSLHEGMERIVGPRGL